MSDNKTGICGHCGGPASGYKCALCGAEAAEHDPNHDCGGENCQPKCKNCNQAESKCGCKS